MDWDTAKAVMQAVPAGGVCWFEDGNYDYSAVTQPYLDITNDNGTIENPIYYLARNKHQVVMIGNSGGWRWYSSHIVVGGRSWSTTGGPNRGVSTIFRNSWVRCTSEKMVGSSKGQLVAANLLIANLGPKHIEMDNLEIDGLNQTDDADSKIRISSLGRDPANIVNNQHIRIHHIWMHDRIYGGTSTYRYIMIGNGEKGDHGTYPEDPIYNEDLGEFKAHIENCLFDNFPGSFESLEIKASDVIQRSNVFKNGSIQSQRLRSGSGHQYSGNWCEANDHGLVHSASQCVVAFNFVQRTEENTARAGISHFDEQRNANSTESMNYRSSNDNLYEHNVFSGFSNVIRAQANTVGLVVTGNQTSNMRVAGNAFYSEYVTPSDDSEVGNYTKEGDLGNGQGMIETDFRFDNDWGTNTYVLSMLPIQTGGIDSNIFDGPGDNLVNSRLSALYGQPSQIKMPSWWKLSTTVTFGGELVTFGNDAITF